MFIVQKQDRSHSFPKDTWTNIHYLDMNATEELHSLYANVSYFKDFFQIYQEEDALREEGGGGGQGGGSDTKKIRCQEIQGCQPVMLAEDNFQKLKETVIQKCEYIFPL